MTPQEQRVIEAARQVASDFRFNTNCESIMRLKQALEALDKGEENTQ